MFLSLRDNLILTIEENDIHRDCLIMTLTHLIGKLHLIAQKTQNPEKFTFNYWIKKAEPVIEELNSLERTFEPDSLMTVKYSEENIQTIREMNLRELINLKILTKSTYHIMINEMEDLIATHK